MSDEQQNGVKQKPKHSGHLLSVKQIQQKVFVPVEGLSAEMRECLGEIEDSFTCIVWGWSANGKTSMVGKLLKELSHVGHILYLSYEEGHGKTVQDMVNRNELDDVPLQFLDHATFEELCIRLNKKQSPKIIIVDSLQYARFTYEQYKELKRQFVFGKVAKRRKIFIFISHANGKHPKGSAAVDIRYDANIKIWVEGFLADIESRYGSKKNYVIWEQRAKLYWGKKFNKMVYKLGKPKTPVVQDESKSITEEAK